jgi:hypothetical protein
MAFLNKTFDNNTSTIGRHDCVRIYTLTPAVMNSTPPPITNPVGSIANIPFVSPNPITDFICSLSDTMTWPHSELDLHSCGTISDLSTINKNKIVKLWMEQ